MNLTTNTTAILNLMDELFFNFLFFINLYIYDAVSGSCWFLNHCLINVKMLHFFIRSLREYSLHFSLVTRNYVHIPVDKTAHTTDYSIPAVGHWMEWKSKKSGPLKWFDPARQAPQANTQTLSF